MKTLYDTPSRMDSSNSDPPLHDSYKTLLLSNTKTNMATHKELHDNVIEECDLPLIDLRRLKAAGEGGEECKAEIADAAREWGFFQVINHGISRDVLEKMRVEQIKVFKQPFDKKRKEDRFLNLSAGSYRWGAPSATRISQFLWSEAFHVPLAGISSSGGLASPLRSSMEEFAGKVSDLAKRLAEILASKMGQDSSFFEENCLESTCYLRMNRYPACPVPSQVLGLMPHTDSDFLTILHQDNVGGLQLVKDGRWFAVNPNPSALIINIGDLFQAWSNGVYKSVEHRVVTNPNVERFSTAYFFCPSYDTVVRSCCKPSLYKEFSFGEYREQVQEDVRNMGFKVGLSRFLV